MQQLPREYYPIHRFGGVNGLTIGVTRASAAREPEARRGTEIGRPLRLRHAAIHAVRLDGEAPLRPPDML